MKIYKDPWTLSGFRLEVPSALDYPFSHLGEYLVTREMTLGEHAHSTWELLLQVEGETSWVHGRRQITVRAGELLLCPPGLRHGKSRQENAEFRFYFLGCRMDPDVWPDLRRHLPADRMTKLPHAGELARSFRILEEELLFDHLRAREGVLLAWKRLWLSVHRLAAGPQQPVNRRQRWLVQRVRTLVESQPGERWTLHAMARLVGYAPNYFAALFKRENGGSFHQYLINARVEAAKASLQLGGESATEIALRLGFSSSQHFSRIFAERAGVPPSRWIACSRGKANRSGRPRGSANRHRPRTAAGRRST